MSYLVPREQMCLSNVWEHQGINKRTGAGQGERSKSGFALLLDQLRQANICTCKMMSEFPLALICSRLQWSFSLE